MELFDQFVSKAKWIFAKTYAKKAPHEYTKLADCDLAEFRWAVRHIRIHGTIKKFWRREYVYFSFKGYSYWTMGAPVEETIIINRVKDE